MPILYDHREERSGIPQRLREQGVTVEGHQLAVGDYIVSDRVVVERKSFYDLSQSIQDGRLFDQIERLREAYPVVVLMVEAEASSPVKMSRQSRYGAMAWALRQGVSVLPVKDKAAVAEWLLLLCRQEEKPSAGQPRGHRRKPKDMDRLAEEVVAGLPGVSLVRAGQLLRAFGTVSKVFSAMPYELQRVEGIGKKTSASMSQLFHHRYRPRPRPRPSDTPEPPSPGTSGASEDLPF